MIAPIPSRRVISIKEKIETVGSEPLYVICDDYEAYYVKNSGLLIPATTLINEVYCHFLLEAWGLPTPKIALVHLETETIKENYGVRHKPVYYDRLAFGSKQVDGAFDVIGFLAVSRKVEFKKYHSPLQFPQIGLFDMWVENEDRPPDLKNVMIFDEDDKYHFLAIDQAMAFRTGAYSSLEVPQFYPTEDNYILQSQFFNDLKRFVKVDKNYLEKEKENFYLCVNNCKQIFFQIIPLIPPSWGMTKEIETLLAGFLFNEERNDGVFNEYVRMWKS